MKSFKYIIQDKVGMHARPAGKLSKFLSSYQSVVTVKYGERKAVAKSVINLMSLGLQNGVEVEFIAEGSDEDKVIVELPEFLKQEGI